jgi:DNA primase
MFYINRNPILADDLEVLNELKHQLARHGILRFNEFKVGPRNIQFNCPIHSNGQEKKPSCGISTVQIKDIPPGTVHCFACGYTASLEEMISHCFGRDDMGAYGREWLVKNFLTVSIENRKDISLDVSRGSKVEEMSYISEEELDSYRYYHPYMYKRKLTDEVIEKFDIGYDEHFELKDKDGKVKQVLRCLTFPVRDKKGNTLFIARRSVDIKFFHYPEGVIKPVYGLYELPDDAKEIIICESILNALTCYVYGKPAVALNGLGTEYQYEQLKRLPARKFIIALDPDEAGQRATRKLRKALRGSKLVTQYEIPKGKDLNDLDEKEFENLAEIF